MKIIAVKNEDLIVLEEMAKNIWRECYTTLLGVEQVEYMIDNFQTKEAFVNQINDGYEYYFVEQEGVRLGYFGIKEDDMNPKS